MIVKKCIKLELILLKILIKKKNRIKVRRIYNNKNVSLHDTLYNIFII